MAAIKYKPESTDGRREGWANWDEGAYKGESLGSIGTDVTRQRVFSSRTGPRERSMAAGNRVIVRSGAAGCTRVPGGREFGGVGSVADVRRQAGNGMARSRARARLNCSSQGQRRGRCRVNRRAERVSRPARAKNRRRRVLVVTICSPKPSRAVQRARLCAITWAASQAALAAKRPEGRWFSPTPYFRSRMAFSISAWRR